MTEEIWFQYAVTLLEAAGVTLQISWLALVLAAAIGAVVAFARMSNILVLRVVALLFTELMRSLPVILVLFFYYYGLPAILGLDISAFTAATAALGLHASANMAEVIRAGVQSVGKGQWEAAHASGMRWSAVMRYVVAPQAFRVILPPAISIFVVTIKASSLATIIGYRELMHAALSVRDQTGYGIEVILVAAFMYFVINYTISHFGGVLERRLAIRTKDSPRVHAPAMNAV